MEHKTEFARQALTRRHLLIAGITAIAASFVATPVFAQESDSVQIIFAGSQPVAYGAPGNFTGRVRVDPLFQADKNINVSGAYVTFEPGARSAWHTHPAGQRLVVVSGIGLTQQEGQPVQIIRPGDVVMCPPGVKHWHGAAPESAMTHLAITGNINGKTVDWMEKVTDEQYHASSWFLPSTQQKKRSPECTTNNLRQIPCLNASRRSP